MTDEERMNMMDLAYGIRDEIMKLPAGSKERASAVDDMIKIIHAINENDRNSNEFYNRQEQNEEQAKKNEEEKRHNKWTHALTIGSLSVAVIDIVKDGVMTLVGYGYEEYHPVASFHLRESLNKMFRKHNPPRV